MNEKPQGTGADGLPGELLKAGGQMPVEICTAYRKQVQYLEPKWDKHCPNKGSCENYRGMSPIAILYGLTSKVA